MKKKLNPTKNKPKKSKDKKHTLAANKTTDLKIMQSALNLEYIFDRGVNFRDRIITLRGDIEDPAFDIIDAAMSEMEHSSKAAVTIRLFSFGGDTHEALAIIGRLTRSKCKIITEGYGAIMSAATLILASGGRRLMSEYCQFMHHESSYCIEGRHQHVKATVDQLERDEKLWSKWMAHFTAKDSKFWYNFGKHTDKYLTAEECKELGIIDEII